MTTTGQDTSAKALKALSEAIVDQRQEDIDEALAVLAKSGSDVKGADIATACHVVLGDMKGAESGRDFWRRIAGEAEEALAAATQRAERAERERDALREYVDSGVCINEAVLEAARAAVEVGEPVSAKAVGDLLREVASLRAGAEKAEADIDAERRQRIHEAGVASDAIGLLRDVVYLLGEGHRGVTARRLLDEGATGPEATQAESDAGRIGAQWLAKVAQAEVAACEFLAEVQP